MDRLTVRRRILILIHLLGTIVVTGSRRLDKKFLVGKYLYSLLLSSIILSKNGSYNTTRYIPCQLRLRPDWFAKYTDIILLVWYYYLL